MNFFLFLSQTEVFNHDRFFSRRSNANKWEKNAGRLPDDFYKKARGIFFLFFNIRKKKHSFYLFSIDTQPVPELLN